VQACACRIAIKIRIRCSFGKLAGPVCMTLHRSRYWGYVAFTYVLPHIRGSRDLKDGFCIWWSSLLDLYTTGYNYSSQTTIWHTVIFFDWRLSLQLNWTSGSTWLDYHSTMTHCDSSLPHTVVLKASRHGPHRKHRSQEYPACLSLRCLETDVLYCWLCIPWNVFTELLPSNERVYTSQYISHFPFTVTIDLFPAC
jgi:hypothetical protein